MHWLYMDDEVQQAKLSHDKEKTEIHDENVQSNLLMPCKLFCIECQNCNIFFIVYTYCSVVLGVVDWTVNVNT